MRKCDKCQIKLAENERYCPICGSEIEGFSAPSADCADFVPLYETTGLDFHNRLKNFLQQPMFAVAVFTAVLNILLNIGLCFVSGDYGIMSISSIAPTALSVIPFILLYADRKNRADASKPLRAMGFLKVLSILQIIMVSVMMILFLIVSVVVTLTGTELFTEILPFEFYFPMEDMDVLGISLFFGTVLGAAVSLPFAISPFLIVRDLICGLKNKNLKKIRGATVFKIYNTVILVSSIFLALDSLSATDSPIFTLLYLLTVISGALPGFLFSVLVSRLNNIVKTEHLKSLYIKQ